MINGCHVFMGTQKRRVLKKVIGSLAKPENKNRFKSMKCFLVVKQKRYLAGKTLRPAESLGLQSSWSTFPVAT